MTHYRLALHYNLLTMLAPEGEDEGADKVIIAFVWSFTTARMPQ